MKQQSNRQKQQNVQAILKENNQKVRTDITVSLNLHVSFDPTCSRGLQQ